MVPVTKLNYIIPTFVGKFQKCRAIRIKDTTKEFKLPVAKSKFNFLRGNLGLDMNIK